MSFTHVAKSTYIQKELKPSFGSGLWPISETEIQKKRKKQQQYREQLLKQIQQNEKKKKRQKQKDIQSFSPNKNKSLNEENSNFKVQLPIYSSNHRKDNQQISSGGHFSSKNYHNEYINHHNNLLNYSRHRNIHMDNPEYLPKTNPNEDLYSGLYDEKSQLFQQTRQSRSKKQQQYLDSKIHEIYEKLSDSISALRIDLELNSFRNKLHKNKKNIQNYQKQDIFYSLPNNRNRYRQNSTMQSGRRVQTQWSKY